MVTGLVKPDKRAPSGYEIEVKQLEVVGESHDYPITPKEHGVDFLFDRRHLWIRSERQQAILTEQQRVAERNAELKERQLDTEVRKPADAERYRVEQEAEARKNSAIADAEAKRQATIAAAQASAEQSRLTGEGERSRRAALAEANAIEGAKEGEAEQRRRVAIAEALEREGAAEASAILARGQAEAEAMKLKADAFATYGEAAILDLLVRVMPEFEITMFACAEPGLSTM